MKKLLVFFFTVFLMTNCYRQQDTKQFTTDNSIFEKTEIICDTAFKNKKYKFILLSFDSTSNDPDKPNTFFTFLRLKNGKYETVFTDTIYCERQGIEFNVFTPNNLKSVLVQNNEDIRNNWTYYLYLVDTTHDKLKKVKGFEEIKNPNYLKKYDLIDNYVISGKAWTSFYKIKKDTVQHFDVVVYDDHTENSSYDREYKKAINSILKKRKTTANKWFGNIGG